MMGLKVDGTRHIVAICKCTAYYLCTLDHYIVNLSLHSPALCSWYFNGSVEHCHMDSATRRNQQVLIELTHTMWVQNTTLPLHSFP